MLEGTKVRLRSYTKADLPKAREYLNDPEVAAGLCSGIPFPFRPEDEEKFYDSIDPNSTKGYSFAIECKESGQYLGGCGMHDIDSKNRMATVGIFLGKEHVGKGYGTDAMQVLVHFCFNEINLNRVKLNVFAFNKRAIRCYRKTGFKIEGTLRQEDRACEFAPRLGGRKQKLRQRRRPVRRPPARLSSGACRCHPFADWCSAPRQDSRRRLRDRESY